MMFLSFRWPVLVGLLALPFVLVSCSLLDPIFGVAGAAAGAALPLAAAKFHFACLPEHSVIDTPNGSRPVEMIEPGDLVMGYAGRPVQVLQKHSYLESAETVFYRVTFENGGAVELCGRHRISGVPARELCVGQVLAGQRVVEITCRRGVTHSYDLLTEDKGYQIHGIAVNSMIDEMVSAAASGKLPN